MATAANFSVQIGPPVRSPWCPDPADQHRFRTRIPRTGLVMLAALGLVLLAGCSDSSPDETASGATSAPPGTVASSEEDPAVEGDPEPEYGGSLTFGLDADPDGFNPLSNQIAPAGMNVARAIYDPLTAIGPDGIARPYLLEDITANETFTEWTLTVRPDVTFHNGDPLTADVLAQHMTSISEGLLTGLAFKPVENVLSQSSGAQADLDAGIITAEEFELRNRQVTLTTSQSWSTLPALLAGTQGGFVAHPDYVTGVIPDPVGTGPFLFEEWIVGDHVRLSRNPTYWREGLPYLDEVVFRIVSDPQTRRDGLNAGELDAFQTGSAADVVRAGNGELASSERVVTDTTVDEMMLLLNTQSGPTADLRVRRALALATDRSAITEGLYDGFFVPASAPYLPDSPWYTDPGWPEPDLVEAQALVDEYEAEFGEIIIRVVAIVNTDNLELAQTIQSQWAQVGIELVLETTDQATFAGQLVGGDFNAILIAFFNGADPDELYPFIDPDGVGAPGSGSVNFSRYTSEVMESALKEARTLGDPEARAELYGQVWKDWAENFPFLFLFHTQWLVIADESVHGISTFTYPDGTPASPMLWGSIFLTSAWRE